MRRAIPPFSAAALILLTLEVLVRSEFVNASLVPAPSTIFVTLIDLRTDFTVALWETTTATLLGYAGALFFGVTAALILSLSRRLRAAVLPFAIFFQTVPIIAIAPLLVIYFGFGLRTVVASAMIVAIFPVLANTLIGLQSVDPGELELFRLYSANRWRTLWRLRFPRAYPSMYAGFKIAAGLAVIGTVAGEFVAGGGLGAMVDSARTQQRTDIVFGALLLLSGLGLAMVGVLRFSHFLIDRWRPYGLHLKD